MIVARTKFKARPGDHTWGVFNYPVTPTQKQALEGLMYMTAGLPRAVGNPDMPKDGFYSQNAFTGAVVFGINHRSVTVMRSGRIYSNERGSHDGSAFGEHQAQPVQ